MLVRMKVLCPFNHNNIFRYEGADITVGSP